MVLSSLFLWVKRFIHAVMADYNLAASGEEENAELKKLNAEVVSRFTFKKIRAVPLSYYANAFLRLIIILFIAARGPR